MTARHQAHPPHPNERLVIPGACALIAGVLILVLQGIEAAHGVPGMPRFWHQNQPIWIAASLIGIVAGWRLLWRSEHRDEAALRWKPSVPGRRFREVTLYTRIGCHLCGEAAEVLAIYSPWLPRMMEIDVDSGPRLVELYGTCVPVVVCDGKVRFKGRVNETLLRRLIEGTPPVDQP